MAPWTVITRTPAWPSALVAAPSPGRDLAEPDLVADIRNAVAGDPSPDGKGVLAVQRGIEVELQNYRSAMETARRRIDLADRSIQKAQEAYDITLLRLERGRAIQAEMLNSRLAEMARRANAPFLGASSSSGELGRTTETEVLGAVVPDGSIDAGLTALITEAERVRRHGFAAAELDRVKRLKIVGEIERLLVKDGARPIISHGAANTCWQPAVKGIVLQQNSIYNNWRFDTVWLDR